MTLLPSANSSDTQLDSVCEQIESMLASIASLQAAVGKGGGVQKKGAQKNSELLSAQQIQSDISQLQIAFQTLLRTLESADLETADQRSILSYKTEAHRRSRLLKVTAMQLRTAKQPQKLMAVRSQLQDHLHQLRNFLQAIEQLLCA